MRLNPKIANAIHELEFKPMNVSYICIEELEELEKKLNWSFEELKKKAPYYLIEGRYGQIARIFENGECEILSDEEILFCEDVWTV